MGIVQTPALGSKPAQKIFLNPPIPAYIEPEGHNQVENNGRSKSEERDIDEIQADAANGNAHSLAQKSTNPEQLFLEKKLKMLHRQL